MARRKRGFINLVKRSMSTSEIKDFWPDEQGAFFPVNDNSLHKYHKAPKFKQRFHNSW